MRSRTSTSLILWLLSALLLSACTSEPPAPYATVTDVIPSTEAVPSPNPTRTPPAGAITELPAMTVLIDVQSGAVVTLYRDTARYESPGGEFLADGTVRYSTFENGRPLWITVDLDGRELSRETDPNVFLPYKAIAGGCEVDVRFFAGVHCGSISPNGRWMVYSKDGKDLPGIGPASDRWLLDLQSGATVLLQEDVRSCTQCDASPRVEWSASGDFLVFGETGGDARVFLIDAPAATSTILATGGRYRYPEWSLTEDILARGREDGTTYVQDVRTGARRDIAVPWPARFEPTGRYLYSVDEDTHTTVAEVATGRLYARLEGITFSLGTPVTQPLVESERGLISALGPTSTCTGTQIYARTQPAFCVAGGGSPVLSRDGKVVAVARKTDEIGPVYTPSVEALNVPRYDIAVVDTSTGRESVLFRGATGVVFPPRMLWNEAGTHLLVWWNVNYGP
jgi:hypothetical protein